MKVYFACSIKGGGDTSSYIGIVEAIKRAGGEVISEIFVQDAIQLGGSPLPADQIYQRDIEMITTADLVVAEVTNPSLGVGYELAYAEKLRKPILCLFDKNATNKLSAMVLGNGYNTIAYFTPTTIHAIVAEFIAQSSPPQILQKRTDHERIPATQ